MFQFRAQKPLHMINATAPIRICDNGGWTDTWFAGKGLIFNIGVSPYAEVQIAVWPSEGKGEHVFLSVENFGDHYLVDPSQPSWYRHPLLEACIQKMGVPADWDIHITLFCSAPAGASTGTSAAVTVALIGALDKLNGGRLSQHAIAETAHAVETEMLKRQSGIQDQLCSAYGGINFITMDEYPRATVARVSIPNPLWWELERRLALIYLGKSHDSSKVHEKVIAELENSGPDCQRLNDLRQTAEVARTALLKGDFVLLGHSMSQNTAAQQRLNRHLVCPDAHRVIEIAQAHGALGWKVNGAGGDGGSLTLLCGPRADVKRALLLEVEQENPLFRVIPIRLDPWGLRVWEAEA
jgi:D-glycero-alpha-D-manno-heptose-7-phosphate kinase